MPIGEEHDDDVVVGYVDDDPVHWVPARDKTPVDQICEDSGWRAVRPVYLFEDHESAAIMGESRSRSICPPDWPGARPVHRVATPRRLSQEEIAEMTPVGAPPPPRVR
jgi:hypothetical protein